MIWRDGELKSPLSGETLRKDSPHSLTDGESRFPVIEEIPFLRADRDDLRRAVLEKLDAGDERSALILLLRDQDDWARSEAPSQRDLQPLFENEDLTLREAMRALRYGAVADYFAYRWSDPTFVSGLCLLETHLAPNAKTVLELACGIGHFLREMMIRGIQATGADVVFSKLWLARKFVAPDAKLICFDANFAFPFADKSFDAAFCHDAFYFLPKKQAVADELERTTRGAILIGHAHNAEAENFSSGAAISTAEYAAMFDDPTLYDDAELTRAAIENRQPRVSQIDDLRDASAIDLVSRLNSEKHSADDSQRLSFLETKQKNLRLNPLLLDANGAICKSPIYPSERYENEYAPLSGYLNLSETERKILSETKNKNDLPDDAAIDDFIRRRILLNLPEKW